MCGRWGWMIVFVCMCGFVVIQVGDDGVLCVLGLENIKNIFVIYEKVLQWKFWCGMILGKVLGFVFLWNVYVFVVVCWGWVLEVFVVYYILW